MSKSANFSIWTYLLFPGIAMLLGWGLRGYIGGGPFGAMIPGAMVALAISMLLGFQGGFTSLVVVFGVVGVGLGGEMTYGQTLGFLKNPDTVWWGTLATTVKGAVWGLGGGAIIGLGLIQNRVPKKTILISLAFLLAGLFIGFKLINDPKLIYFSDPINKPRSESWGALFIGALALIGYLKIKIEKDDFKILIRFAKWGLISGGLGFGLGGLWMVLGTYVPLMVFSSWWKMMEFTFGLLLGAGLGYAAWLSRNEFSSEQKIKTGNIELGKGKEIISILVISLVVYFVYPALMEPIADQLNYDQGILSGLTGDLFRLLINYAFYGFVMILIVLYKKELAWQIGITLTFCHTTVDLMRDMRPQPDVHVNMWIQIIVVLVLTMIVAYLVAHYRRGKNVNNSMFQILIWSTMTIAFTHLSFSIFLENALLATGFLYLIIHVFFVHIVFLSSAIYTSRKSMLISE